MKNFQLALLFIFVLSSSISYAQDNPCAQELPYTSIEEGLEEPEKVIYLDLAMQHPKLTSIPKEVALFPNLVCLDVSFNRVASIPDEIKQCKNLQTLILAGNRYLAKMPEVLKDVASLKTVDVSDIPEWSVEKRAEAKALLPVVNVITD